MTATETRVMILGSAPDAATASGWPKEPFTHVVAINNAWRLRADWDILIHPEDFPPENRPPQVSRDQRIVTAADYVAEMNRFGGVVFVGATMAFTAGYWALGALRPKVIAYLGCDMVYPSSGRTHFYGTGVADPLRSDVTLRSLEAKSARLALLAARQSCRVVRLSQGQSRLVVPPVARSDLAQWPLPKTDGVARILAAEQELGYDVPSGRYWECIERFDPTEIDRIDRAWLQAYAQATGTDFDRKGPPSEAQPREQRRSGG